MDLIKFAEYALNLYANLFINTWNVSSVYSIVIEIVALLGLMVAWGIAIERMVAVRTFRFNNGKIDLKSWNFRNALLLKVSLGSLAVSILWSIVGISLGLSVLHQVPQELKSRAFATGISIALSLPACLIPFVIPCLVVHKKASSII